MKPLRMSVSWKISQPPLIGWPSVWIPSVCAPLCWPGLQARPFGEVVWFDAEEDPARYTTLGIVLDLGRLRADVGFTTRRLAATPAQRMAQVALACDLPSGLTCQVGWQGGPRVAESRSVGALLSWSTAF